MCAGLAIISLCLALACRLFPLDALRTSPGHPNLPGHSDQLSQPHQSPDQAHQSPDLDGDSSSSSEEDSSSDSSGDSSEDSSDSSDSESEDRTKLDLTLTVTPNLSKVSFCIMCVMVRACMVCVCMCACIVCVVGVA